MHRALGSFDQGDLLLTRECLESQLDNRYWARDPEIFPLWDPTQLLSTSQTLLLRAATLQAELSEDEETGSIGDEFSAK